VKTIVVIAIGSVVSGLIIVQIMFLLFANTPEVFIAGNESPAVESLQQSTVHDSLAVSNSENHKDSVIVEKPVEIKTTGHIEKKEKNISEKKIENINVAAPITVTDSVDVKSQAKMLEAMGVDGAAKVMSTMNDKEVKAILPKLKKRTAAKILVSFDPIRAARLLR
jgi:flagellar motility protein MotE (MotC chaperone)